MTIMDGQDAAAAPQDDLIKDTTDQRFLQDVIEPSKQVPVIVDFWAPWCGPCRQLTPMIEHAVLAAGGAVKLVKINIDESPAVAQQLRVQSIPAVFAFKDGQPVDGFMGAIPESQIQGFIKRLTGEAVDEVALAASVDEAVAALDKGDLSNASQILGGVLQQDPGHPGALATLSRVWLANGDKEKAQTILDQVPEDRANDPAVDGARSALELAGGEPGDDAETATLRARVKADGTDFQARYDLAELLIAAGDHKGAADQLLAITSLDREWNEQAARTLLLKLFEAAGPNSEVTRDGRRRLSSILFS